MVEYSSWEEPLSDEEDALYVVVQQKWDDGDFYGAVTTLQILLEENPKSVLFNVTLGHMYRKISKEEKDLNIMVLAEKYYKTAAYDEPTSGLLSGLYFHCLWDLDRGSDAIKEMKRFKAVGDPDEYKDLEEEFRDEIKAEISNSGFNKSE